MTPGTAYDARAVLRADDLAAALAEPSRSGLPRRVGPSPEAFAEQPACVRTRGWALADEELHLPLLLRAAADVSDDWTLWQSRPHLEVPDERVRQASR